MTELYIYRFIMFCLVVTAGLLGIRYYGDYRVHQVLLRQGPPGLVVPGLDQGYRLPYPAVPLDAQSQGHYNPGRALPPAPSRHSPGPPPVHANYAPLPAVASMPPTGVPDAPSRPQPNPAPLTQLSPPSSPPPTRSQGLSNQDSQFQDPQSLPVQVPGNSRHNEVATTEDPVVAEIQAIQRRLGGSRVAEILAIDGDASAAQNAERVFLETLQKLQAGQTFDEGPRAMSVASSRREHLEVPLTVAELEIVRRHLRCFAEQWQTSDPAKAAAWVRLADRLTWDPEPGPHAARH